MAPAIGNRQSAIGKPLRVGVIGLGPLWRQHYQPALAALSARFQVLAVCDQIDQRATEAATRLVCAAAAGPTALLLDPAAEAVLLLDPQWYRLWPVLGACRLGKPVLCAPSLALDDAHADDLYQRVHAARLPVLMAMTPRLAPALERLRELLDTRLGPVRLVLCESVTTRHPTDGERPAALAGEAALLDCCSAFLPGDPVSVLAYQGPDCEGGVQTPLPLLGSTVKNSLTSLLLEYDAGRAIQINQYQNASLDVHRGPSTIKLGEDESAGTSFRSKVRVRVVGERGTASAVLPGRVRWADSEGRHIQSILAAQPAVQVVLEQFYRVVREGQPPQPDLARAYQLLQWTRAAMRSRSEGRRVSIADCRLPIEDSSGIG
jgi:predicted dehydrogenase